MFGCSYAIKKKDEIERVAKANREGASGTEDYNFKSKWVLCIKEEQTGFYLSF